eukprot:jgi/Phyca11/14650/fgenesh1_pg.PHYCAscaffold_9_\
MVTQRVTPIRPDDAGAYHTGKAALNEMLRRDDSPHSVEQAEALDDAVGDDMAQLGVAVNTRNYQALLDNLAHRRRTGSGSSISNGYQRQTVALGAVYQQNRENQVESEELAQTVAVEEEEEDEEERDRTVVGLPVDTRNYEAIVGGGRPIRSDPGTFNLLNRRATVGTMPQMPHPMTQEKETQGQPVVAEAVVAGDVGEDDAVMGLPISTGNYVAYLAGQQGSGLQQAGHRNRGYSNLAQEKEPRYASDSLP